MWYHEHCCNIDIYLEQVVTSERIRESLKLEETSNIITSNLWPITVKSTTKPFSKCHIYTSHHSPGRVTHPNCISFNIFGLRIFVHWGCIINRSDNWLIWDLDSGLLALHQQWDHRNAGNCSYVWMGGIAKPPYLLLSSFLNPHKALNLQNVSGTAALTCLCWLAV